MVGYTFRNPRIEEVRLCHPYSLLFLHFLARAVRISDRDQEWFADRHKMPNYLDIDRENSSEDIPPQVQQSWVKGLFAG